MCKKRFSAPGYLEIMSKIVEKKNSDCKVSGHEFLLDPRLGCGANLKGKVYSVSHFLHRKNQISFYEDLVV